jgi:hypothetical protein
MALFLFSMRKCKAEMVGRDTIHGGRARLLVAFRCIWLYPRERHLSHRLHAGYAEIIGGVCTVRGKLNPKRFRSLCSYP